VPHGGPAARAAHRLVVPDVLHGARARRGRRAPDAQGGRTTC
jgi:hypothetical protein